MTLLASWIEIKSANFHLSIYKFVNLKLPSTHGQKFVVQVMPCVNGQYYLVNQV